MRVTLLMSEVTFFLSSIPEQRCPPDLFKVLFGLPGPEFWAARSIGQCLEEYLLK